VLFVFLPDIVGLVMWPLCASAVRKGRQWGAVVGTVLFGIDLIFMLSILLAAHDAPLSKLMSVIIWGLGVVTVILVWNSQSRAYYRAFR